MNRIKILTAALLIIMAAACEQEVRKPVPGTSLGQIYVSPAAGSRSVSVSLDGLWRVSSLSEWISLDVNGRSGSSAFTFSYTSNESNLLGKGTTRKGAITICSLDTNVCDTLYVIQQGLPDGIIHETVITSDYIESIQEEQTWQVLYCNLQGQDYAVAEAYLESCTSEITAAIWNGSDAAMFTSGCEKPCMTRNGILIIGSDIDLTPDTDTYGVISRHNGTNIQVADLDPELDPEKELSIMTSLLDEGYNTSTSGDRWLIGGSFYFYSSVEAGYPDTPSWYPASSDEEDYDADRYIWSNNLIDCIWMASNGFNPTYSDGERSWRADYVYASGKTWNGVVDVKILEKESGMKHNPVMLTLKY